MQEEYFKDVKEIELDQSIYGKAVIRIKDKEGYFKDVINVRWSKREEVFSQINQKWVEYLKRSQNE